MSGSSRVTILMYHYVRDLQNSRYPNIRGLDLQDFKSQLDYLKEYYSFVTIEDVIMAIEQEKSLPDKAVLLTFSDSYSDHFNNVFPLLEERNIQGCFYPEVAAIQEERVLLNHKIHFVLASAVNSAKIKEYIFSILNEIRDQHQLYSNQHYYNKLAKASKYDSKDTIFIKRILQTALPEKVRENVSDQLFKEFVGVDQKIFSNELYLDRKQIETMINHGMHFGILGYHHCRYDNLQKQDQQREINRAASFIVNAGMSSSTLSVSYPWGAYNADTLEILKEAGCKVGFTTNAAIADLNNHPALELPRLDANEMPKKRTVSPNHWYSEA